MSSQPFTEQANLFESLANGHSTQVCLEEMTEPSHGVFWTASISEWPNEDDVYTHTSLSEQVLRDKQDASFYLTPEACAAILTRGSRNEMRLDRTLEMMLRRQSGQ